MLSKLLPKLRSALVCAISLLATASLAQTTINVGPGQTYTTIQSGIDAAVNGDTVLVAPGTYYENIDFKGKAITVTSSGGAASTIIDGSLGQIAAVTFKTNETLDSVLNGFTVQGGGLEDGLAPESSLPGIYISDAAPTISNNIITHNHCNGILSSSSSPLIKNNEIDNTLDARGNCYFSGGTAILLVGSLSYDGVGSTETVPPAVVIDNVIQNNTQSGQADSLGGAAVALWNAYAQIIGNTMRNNLTSWDGGAILSYNLNAIVIVGNLIYGNQAVMNGAMSLHPPEATTGPFIGIIASNTIYGNTQTFSAGGLGIGDAPPTEVYLDGNLAQYVLVNNIIVGSGSTVAVACGSVYNYLSITPLVFDHNDIYNPNGPAYGAACPDQTNTYGNISGNPLFNNPSAGDFTLRSGSPAIDAGNNSAPQMTTTDLAGSPRIQDATGKGYPVVDMGAYEFAGHQDAAPTVLTLTPSEYFTALPLPSYPPLTFTSTLTSAAGTPSGPVTIYVDSVAVTTINVGSSGSATFSLPGLAPGLHAFTSTYTGSGTFPPAVSVKFYLLIPVTSTALKIASSINPSLDGSPVTFTVTASAGDGSIPSPITLTDTTTGTLLTTLSPNSSGVATYTTSTLAVGYHNIEAAFAGSSSYNASSASLLQDVIIGSPTTTALTCTPSAISINGIALLTATVASTGGTPTGTLAFTDNGTALGQVTATNGVGSLSYQGQSTGGHTIVATYTPTGAFAGSAASCTETVTALPSTSVLTVNPTSSTYGSPVMLRANVAAATPPGAGTPTGTVTFYNGAAAIGTGTLANGGASLMLSSLPGGDDNLTCAYGGNSVYAASNCNTVPVTINAAAAALTLSSSNNPAGALSPIVFTVRLTTNGLSAGAGNTISLNLNGQSILLTTDATGSATYNINTLTPGSYPVTANFAATASLLASSASLTEVVTVVPTATSLTVTPNPAYLSQPVTIVASVSSQTTSTQVNSGNVTFFDGTTALGTQPVASGTASFTISTLALGTHPITATFVPANNSFVTSTSPVVNEVILPSGFTIALSPATITLAPGASGAVAIQLASIGNFAGPLTLAYGTLPTDATASIHPATVTLTAGGAGSSTLTLNTLLKSASMASAKPGPRGLPVVFAAFTLLLVPLSFARRRKLARLLGLAVVVFALQAITGCNNEWYTATVVAPGTYDLPVTAMDASHNVQTATLTVTVTP